MCGRDPRGVCHEFVLMADVAGAVPRLRFIDSIHVAKDKNVKIRF